MSDGSSPHTRGALSTFPPLAGEPGIIPAYAGSTCDNCFRCRRCTDHPRIRGEHIAIGRSMPSVFGSSPHTRGAPQPRRRPPRRPGIIPAYAGSTVVASTPSLPRRDHPRIRGEHLRRKAPHREGLGSSPHTRGARRRRPPSLSRRRIIPAYAGSTPGSGTIAGSSQDHPRIRGEHRRRRVRHAEHAGSSPHTRGAHHVRQEAGRRIRIIPAYAGSTG